MLAARFHGQHDIRIEDVPTPTPSAPDDILVEVHWCGICGTDLHEYAVGPIVTPTTPHPLTGVTLPQTLGHEFSATVVELGSDVRDVAVGDRVAIMPAIVCGRCYFCRRGQGHLCLVFACTGLSAETGGLAQYAVVKEYQVAKLPDSVSDLEGAVIEPAAVAAYGVDRAGVTGGDVVLVTGAGPIGILSAMYASAVGAGPGDRGRAQPQPGCPGRLSRHRRGDGPDRPRLRRAAARPHGRDRGRPHGRVLRHQPRPGDRDLVDASRRRGRADGPAHQAGPARRHGAGREGPLAARQLVLPAHRLAPDHPHGRCREVSRRGQSRRRSSSPTWSPAASTSSSTRRATS